MAEIAQALAATATAQSGAYSHCVALLHQHLCQAVCLQILPTSAGILVLRHHHLHQLQSSQTYQQSSRGLKRRFPTNELFCLLLPHYLYELQCMQCLLAQEQKHKNSSWDALLSAIR